MHCSVVTSILPWLKCEHCSVHERILQVTTRIKTMATYGRIKEFSPETYSMQIYLDEVQAYFVANKIDDDQKAMVMLSSIGSPTFTKLNDLLAPKSPLTKTYR